MDVWAYEHQAARCGYRRIAGIDEAGRGPLAGPVVAAAVVLPPDFHHPQVKDSKKLTPARRNRMYHVIYERAMTVGIGIVDAVEIDLIARDGGTLVFIEVKARQSLHFGNPKWAVTPRKQHKLSMVALYYLKITGQSQSKARFDVVAIYYAGQRPEIEIVQNAFELFYG